MTALIVIVAAMTAAAVAAVVWPLTRRPAAPAAKRAEYDLAVYRDQLDEIERDRERGLLDATEAEAARLEVQRRMLAAADGDAGDETPPPLPGRVLAGGLVASIAAAAIALYLALGSPDVPNFPFAGRDAGALVAGDGAADAEVARLAEKLAARLKESPDDFAGWLLLARTYGTIGEFGKSAQAFRRAHQLAAGRVDVAVLYGEALMRAAKGQVTPEALKLFDGIAAAEPLNPQARYYVGLALAQQNRIGEALQAWVDLKALSPNDAPWLAVVDEQIGRAEAEMKIAAGSVTPSAAALALAKQRPPAAASSAPATATSSAPATATSSAPATATSSAPATATPKGDTGQPGPSAAEVEAAAKMSAGERTEMIRAMVTRLAERLRDNPNDVDGWRRLARSYQVLGETEKAKQAEARAEALEKKPRP